MVAWFYSTDGKVPLGPVGEEDVRRMARLGTLAREHLVWREGMADWAEAGHVDGLFDDAALLPPLPPPRADVPSPAACPPPPPPPPPPPAEPEPARGWHAKQVWPGVYVAGYAGSIGSRARPVSHERSPVSRVAYILLGLFLGTLGIHNFVAGYVGRGIAQLLVTVLAGWLVLPVVGIWIWNVVEVCVTNRDASGRLMR